MLDVDVSADPSLDELLAAFDDANRSEEIRIPVVLQKTHRRALVEAQNRALNAEARVQDLESRRIEILDAPTPPPPPKPEQPSERPMYGDPDPAPVEEWDATAWIDERIRAAREEHQRLDAEARRAAERARPWTVYLRFGRCATTAEYQALVATHTQPGSDGNPAVDFAGLYAALTAACYRGAEAAKTGHDLGRTWDQVKEQSLTEADLANVWTAVYQHNLELTAFPPLAGLFEQGQPGSN